MRPARLGRPLAAALLAAATALTAGCAVVVVRPQGDGKPVLHAYPLGVRIERGGADAIGVRQWSVGLWSSCHAAGVGFASSFCVVINPATCAVAIMEEDRTSRPDRSLLARISDQAEADCLHAKKGPK